MENDQLSNTTNKSRYKMVLSTLYNTSVGSLSFLLSMLVASVIALIILFCFFNVIIFVITLLVIIIMFLSVLAGSAFVIFGGIFLLYTNYR
jgi:hypothetical protein